MDTIPGDFEKLVFEKSRVNEEKLLAYGFHHGKTGWKISIPFHDGAFTANIHVRPDGTVIGRVIETEMNEEYLPLRVASQTSAFVSTIRQEYFDLLTEIRDKAFDEQLFISDQANRIAEKIAQEFHDVSDRPFAKGDHSVFRVPGSNKWYGLVMHVERAKVQSDDSEGRVDVINLKSEDSEHEKLICESGIWPAWHMNKKKWISVVLDDTLKDERIMALIRTSRKLICGNEVAKTANEYIVPSNPNYYDIKRHFKIGHISEWKQTIRVNPGDIVYIYSGAPDSCILFRTEVVETDIPFHYQDANLKMKKIMRLKVLKRYPPELLTMKVLRTFGIRSMHGARKVPVELKKVIDSLSDIE